MSPEQDERIAGVVARDGARLQSFIRSRVRDPRDAEDILQDVFSELIEANRLLMPIDHISGWLFQVAKNRIIDLFRRRKPEALEFEDLLPSPDDGPEAALARSLLVDALERAIEQLPKEQREVFIAHEIDGRSFKDISAATGVNINTLLSRKRYAVLQLRQQLQAVRDELT
jgi:RNA polymerase sigma factor (sigma-70 family)